MNKYIKLTTLFSLASPPESGAHVRVNTLSRDEPQDTGGHVPRGRQAGGTGYTKTALLVWTNPTLRLRRQHSEDRRGWE